jgi:heme exporter protein D
MSDTEKIWLAVGICLAILLALLVIYLVSGKLRRVV